MNKEFVLPEINILEIVAEDIIRTSDGDIGELEGLFPKEEN